MSPFSEVWPQPLMWHSVPASKSNFKGESTKLVRKLAVKWLFLIIGQYIVFL